MGGNYTYNDIIGTSIVECKLIYSRDERYVYVPVGCDIYVYSTTDGSFFASLLLKNAFTILNIDKNKLSECYTDENMIDIVCGICVNPLDTTLICASYLSGMVVVWDGIDLIPKDVFLPAKKSQLH